MALCLYAPLPYDAYPVLPCAAYGQKAFQSGQIYAKTRDSGKGGTGALLADRIPVRRAAAMYAVAITFRNPSNAKEDRDAL